MNNKIAVSQTTKGQSMNNEFSHLAKGSARVHLDTPTVAQIFSRHVGISPKFRSARCSDFGNSATKGRPADRNVGDTADWKVCATVGVSRCARLVQYALILTTCLLPLSSLAQSGPVPAAPGLVAWWSGDGNASDVLGINNGVIYGATFTTGRVGQAFSFDGTGANVITTTVGLPTGTDDRTIEFWARLDSLPTSPNYAFLTGYGGFGQSQATFEVGTSSDGSLWWSQWGTGVTGPQLQAGQWYHLAVTSEDGTVNLYLDGSLVVSGVLPFNTPMNTSFFLGAIPPWTGVLEQLQGALDEISVYNRALSPDEIGAIYQAGSAGKIKPSPRLDVASSGKSVLVWWPTNATSFVLETSPRLGTNQSWSTFAGQVFVFGDQNLVVADVTGPSRFFRLHKP